MARITMRNSQKATFAEVFEVYISAVTARGVKDKTIATYKQHFHAISKRLDVSMPINRLTSTVLDNMILQMRKEGLSDSSINSYTRTLKCFLSWCNEEGYTKANLKIYKAAETVKETYTDEELLTLLKKPEADCKFCEYRNWVIVNFLLNSGCRAATVRNIQNQDVDLSRRQIVLRHRHDSSQDTNAARVSINHISQNIKSILTLQINLLHYGIESAFIAMDICNHIFHLRILLSKKNC